MQVVQRETYSMPIVKRCNCNNNVPFAHVVADSGEASGAVIFILKADDCSRYVVASTACTVATKGSAHSDASVIPLITARQVMV